MRGEALALRSTELEPISSRVLKTNKQILTHCGIIVHILREQILLQSVLSGGAGAGNRWTGRKAGLHHVTGGHRCRIGRQAVRVQILSFWKEPASGVTVQQPLHRDYMRPVRKTTANVETASCLSTFKNRLIS